ncbi:septum formation family protein [Dactylosporangium aurantiacum]|uniref:Septum formation family protein n=1 Tax=Dactylosporangium aurantiacum TaxID=35754 RepID=A0A9Q9IF66_9ACTN|nr:septum formation family protein [Dactylosporangium aurantiacum]MDG6101010.1 septum formation family protein [Dactylosporangium aurantiacum]UWZ54947.1 septum formation family protein [Dactylosporangium aurantiacum]
MKRWTVGLSMTLVLLVAGCGNPAGTDGDLFNGWSALAAPTVPKPAAGECWTFNGDADKLAVGPDLVEVECTVSHSSETIHVGEFSGSLAQKASVPAGADLTDAFAACQSEANNFLGGDWHDGRLVLRVLPPSEKQWKGEAHYYRCDLVEVSDDTYTIAPRTTSLKDTLRGNRPVEIGCVKVETDSSGGIEDFVPTKCDTLHNGEYTGTFYSPDARPYPSDANARRALLQPGCKTIVARYLGLTDAQFDGNKQISFAWSTATPTRWSHGDRTARCYLMLEGNLSVSRSLRANGNVPI